MLQQCGLCAATSEHSAAQDKKRLAWISTTSFSVCTVMTMTAAARLHTWQHLLQ
jgi:uncharacterized protein (DUF983 family)